MISINGLYRLMVDKTHCTNRRVKYNKRDYKWNESKKKLVIQVINHLFKGAAVLYKKLVLLPST